MTQPSSPPWRGSQPIPDGPEGDDWLNAVNFLLAVVAVVLYWVL